MCQVAVCDCEMYKRCCDLFEQLCLVSEDDNMEEVVAETCGLELNKPYMVGSYSWNVISHYNSCIWRSREMLRS